MKKIILICLVAIMLLSVCGCGNREYSNLIEKNANDDILYVGVRSDLTIVSNVYSEVDLKELGLASNAYFICGNDEYMYFGVQQGSDSVHIEVMEYSFKDNSLLKCSEIDKGYRVASIDGKTFYYFEVDEEMTWKGYEYTWIVYQQQKGDNNHTKVYETEIDAYPTYAQANKYINDFLVAPYEWVDSTTNANIKYMSDGTNTIQIQPLMKKSEDAVLSMIVAEKTNIKTHFAPTAEGKAVICINFEDHDNFFLYTYNGDFEFMFAEKVAKKNANNITAIYTIDPQQ